MLTVKNVIKILAVKNYRHFQLAKKYSSGKIANQDEKFHLKLKILSTIHNVPNAT